MDTTSERGKRTVARGIEAPAAKALLKGFNFNIKSEITKVLTRPVKVSRATGKISIHNLVPVNDMNFPSGATHVKFTGAFAKLDFKNEKGFMMMSQAKRITLDRKGYDVLFLPVSSHKPSIPAISGQNYVLKPNSRWKISLLEKVTFTDPRKL